MVTHLGWHYLPVVIISSLVMLGWAFIWMNLGSKRYPVQWAPPNAANTGLDAFRKIRAKFASGRREQQNEGEKQVQEKKGSDETLKNQQAAQQNKEGTLPKPREEWQDEEPQAQGEAEKNPEERLSRWARHQAQAQ
jgi:hypothetical protein